MRPSLVILSIPCLLSGCSESDGNGPPLGSATVTVEVDAVSNALAPTFGLTPAQAGDLDSRLRKLELTQEGSLLPQERPGYLGFWLQSAGDETSVPVSMWIGQGIVIDVSPEGIRRTFLDTEGVEDKLLDIAKDRGYGDFFTNGAEGVIDIPPPDRASSTPLLHVTVRDFGIVSE